MSTLTSRMKTETSKNIKPYLDSARVFNDTALAEYFLSLDSPDDEESYFEAASEVGEWATKTYKLNR